jgi:tRNA(adenine34) deaminase
LSWAETDIERMQVALVQARKAAALGEVPVGALVCLGDEIISTAYNRTIADRDPSGHAEIVALRAAAAAQKNHRLPDTTLYVTLEPCAMCMGAIAQARVSRVVFGAYDPKAGAAGSVIDLADSRALNHHAEINGGVLEAECAAMLRDFFAQRR